MPIDRAYLLRLNQLAKLCQFSCPESIESNREEWISQVFISGLVSRDMCSKILEKELLVAEDVYQMAEVIERSHKETLQFENIRFHKPEYGGNSS